MTLLTQPSDNSLQVMQQSLDAAIHLRTKYVVETLLGKKEGEKDVPEQGRGHVMRKWLEG